MSLSASGRNDGICHAIVRTKMDGGDKELIKCFRQGSFKDVGKKRSQVPLPLPMHEESNRDYGTEQDGTAKEPHP
jgi:hypothetical protein